MRRKRTREKKDFLDKLPSILTLLVLTLSITGCQQNQMIDNTKKEISDTKSTGDTQTEISTADSSVTGKVTAIEGTIVTLQLGELAGQGRGGWGNRPLGNGKDVPALPSENPAGETEENGGMTQFSSSGFSSGAGGGNNIPPEISRGKMSPRIPEEGTWPEAPGEGSRPGEVPPELPEGEAVPFGDEKQHVNQGMSPFFAGEETAIIDLADAAIQIESRDGNTEGSIDDVAIEDILMIEMGEGDKAVAVTIRRFFTQNPPQEQSE